MKRSTAVWGVLWALVGLSDGALADQFHYSNLLIGDRAIGLAGAYTGVSDDASGVFYNPAGLAFALSNDISGSANAIYSRKSVYKETIGGSDFTEQSGGTLPSFFGGLQKLDHIMKGLVFAFGVYTVDSELKDQDDLIKNVNLGQPTACVAYDTDGVTPQRNADGSVVRGSARRATTLDRFHRTVNQRGSTFFAGGALGWRVGSNFSVGVGVNYLTVDELVQEYQDVRTKLSLCQLSGGNLDYTEQKEQNIRQHLVSYGVQPVLAMQWAFAGKFSFGLTLKKGSYVSQSFEQGYESRSASLADSAQTSVDSASSATGTSTQSFHLQQSGEVKGSKPLGTLPLEVRTGIAYFYSTRLLMTFDTSYYGKVSGAEDIPGVGAIYAKEAVINYAAGLEYYLVPAVPLRMGFFTNNDARPDVESKKTGQRDHIDYIGGTMFLAWVQPNSQIGAGVMLQQGKGKSQKIAGSSVIQTVEADSFTFAFSATHSF